MALTPPPFLAAYDTPDSLPSLRTNNGGVSKYSDVEFGTSLGFRPVRMDITIPGGGAAAVPVVVYWLRRFGPAIGLRPDAIGSWGESAGAHLAAFLGLNNTGEVLNGSVGVTGVAADVQATVAWFPPTDFLTMGQQAPDSPEALLIGGAVQEQPDAARFASPVSHVSAAAAPMLLVHGLADRLVPYQQSVSLKEALDKAGTQAALELIPDADHVFEGVDVAPIISRSADFLAGQLH
jgi:acetyl esterase/lipase